MNFSLSLGKVGWRRFLRWYTLSSAVALAFIIAGNIWFSSASIAALTVSLLVQGTFSRIGEEGPCNSLVFLSVSLSDCSLSTFYHYGAFSLFLRYDGRVHLRPDHASENSVSGQP